MRERQRVAAGDAFDEQVTAQQCQLLYGVCRVFTRVAPCKLLSCRMLGVFKKSLYSNTV